MCSTSVLWFVDLKIYEQTSDHTFFNRIIVEVLLIEICIKLIKALMFMNTKSDAILLYYDNYMKYYFTTHESNYPLCADIN